MAFMNASNSGIATRLLWAGLATVLLISLFWAGTLSYFLHEADRAILERRIAGQALVLIYKAESAKYEYLQDFLVKPSDRPASLKQHQEAVLQLDGHFRQLARISAPTDAESIQGLLRAVGEYKLKFEEFLEHHRQMRLDDPKWRLEWHDASDGLDHILGGMEDPVEKLVSDSSGRADHSRRQLLWAAIFLLILGIGTGAAVFYGFARSITKPLVQLKDAAIQIGEGHLDTGIDVEAPGEVGTLAKAFKRMIENVRRHQSVAIQAGKMAAVGQFAAGVAHDINNPVGVIMGFAQSLLRRLPETDPLRLPLVSIEREALRCKTLVQNLLAFSRSNKPTTTLKMEYLPQVLEGALTLVETLARSKKVELIRTLAADLPPVSVDSTQIQQAVINLCTNAIDAMPEGGKLTVSLSRMGDRAEIAVQDTGAGIPPEIRGKIFEAFFTTKEVGKGTGLGLSLIANIAKSHQGELTLQSETGKGSTFTLHLPINASPAARLAA